MRRSERPSPLCPGAPRGGASAAARARGRSLLLLFAAVGLQALSACGLMEGAIGQMGDGWDATALPWQDAGKIDAGNVDAGRADAGKADGSADAGEEGRAPAIAGQPQSLTVTEDERATFSVEAEGTAPLRYQWTLDGQSLSGATGATYTVSRASAADIGSYTVAVSNSYGSVVSDPATLSISDAVLAPSITRQPANQAVTEGSAASFSVAANGSAPLAYRWAFGGQPIAGATSASYTIASATAANAGSYTVTVSNGAGSVESSPATLTVSSGGETCDQGTTTTAWATNCSTNKPPCTAGTWLAGGPDPDHAGFRLLSESEHFAVYSDESPSGAKSAVDYLETVWSTYFGSPIYMREPLCDSSTKYKASIHVHSDWGLYGGSWEPGRMGMWIGTGGLSDHWGLAHEFMHGVQAVQGGQSCGGSDTCGWVHESDANWHPQQMPEYHTSELHCSEMLVNSTHLYLGSTRNRYCNWQFLEFLKDKYCFSAANAIWTGSPTSDPFTAIMNGQKWSISQLNDFFGEWAMHNVTWDYQDPAPQSTAGKNQGSLYRSRYGLVTDKSRPERRLRLTKLEPLDSSYASHRRFVSPYYWAPQRWGYNIIRLFPDSGATSVTVTFRGVIQSEAKSDFRWGLVATDSGISKPRYSALQKGTDGQLTFCVNPAEPLFLVVMGTPSAMQKIVWDQAYSSIYRYPYMVQLTSAWPEGFQGGKPEACPSGTTRVSNGGGCGPSSLPSSVYVGPYAQVLGGSVSGNARIEDHATILGGSVSSGTVGAMSLIASFNVRTSGKVLTTFYPLGFFEGEQGVSGSASLVGDVEFRGQGYDRSSGTCSGFVDSSTCVNASEVTVAPPYTWRP